MALHFNQELQNKYPNLEISVLKYSDAMKDNDSKRIDSEFFKKEYLENLKILKNHNVEILGNLVKKITGGATPLGANYPENGVPFLRVQNIMQNYFNLSDIVYISQKDDEDIKRSRLKLNDVLLTITGVSYGKSAVVDKHLVGANINQHSVKIEVKSINPYFLSTFLNSKFGYSQSSKSVVGITRPALDYQAIKKFIVPIFSNEFQQQIEQMVRQSHECLKQSKDLYREAEVLLYQELGLNPQNPLATIAPVSQSLNFSVRTLKESLHTTGRLDSEYYQIKYDEILRLIKNQRFAKLSDLVDIQKSIEPGSEAYQENGIPFIRVSNFNKFGISDTDIFLDFAEFSQTIKPKKETILLSKDGSIGTAYCVKDDGDFITSSALLHLNIKNEKSKEILPEYLTLVLNSVLVKLQAERDSGGSIIAHWRINEIEEILIPILDISIQEKIENLIKQSFALRVKANELLQSAKTKVETAIEQA